MEKKLLNYVPENNRVAFAKDLYACFPTEEVKKIIIKFRIKHLFKIGYKKKQIALSISNEFNKSSRSAYRYIESVEAKNGKD